VLGRPVSWRDVILIAGGLFLLYKGTREIHERLEGEAPHGPVSAARTSFGGVVVQIMVLDIVFSLDSVITAVGMANELWVMATAIVIAVVIMLAASGPLAAFVDRHPTVKMLALSFLLLIGMTLVADGAGFHVPKGYIYATPDQLLRGGRTSEPARRASAQGPPQRQSVGALGSDIAGAVDADRRLVCAVAVDRFDAAQHRRRHVAPTRDEGGKPARLTADHKEMNVVRAGHDRNSCARPPACTTLAGCDCRSCRNAR